MEEKKRFSINGISIYRIFGYFIIYSVLGYILETTFALVVYSKLESRQGFLYGPLCPIYGVGATALIVTLQKFKKNGNNLFIGGFIVGSIVEYVISLIGEIIFNVRWWDYSDRFLNINGRICLLYSIYWGIISVFFMKKINTRVDKFIEWLKSKISVKRLKILTVAIIIIMLIDFILSGFVTHLFLSRTVVENDLQVKNRQIYEGAYNNIYKNKYVEKLMTNVWNEHFIVKIYPNLKLKLTNGSDVWVQDYYKYVLPYFYKFEHNK